MTKQELQRPESGLHLFQPPLYHGPGGEWHKSFLTAAGDCQNLTWDTAAILSLLSFSYACSDRTLVNEVKRRPWLSDISDDGTIHLETIPQHGWQLYPLEQVVDTFIRLLCEEAVEVCKDRKEIYILLSGGMDSRVVGCILAKAFKEGRIPVKPVAVTWGVADCRDVVYGRRIANFLGFDWKHIELGVEDVVANIDECWQHAAALVSPMHLHQMRWFRHVSPESLVIAGSYGDMVGRAEFSGRHLLELDYLRPKNPMGIVRTDVCDYAYSQLNKDLAALHLRSGSKEKYVHCEHEMHGHYTRGLLAQAMNVINQYCSVYQMYTHPRVYSYIWSLHPSIRFDGIYARTLEKLAPELAHVPWARTNRALHGRTRNAKSGLLKNFHKYESWICGPVYEKYHDYVDPEWFSATQVFDGRRVHELTEQVFRLRGGKDFSGLKLCEIWLWLISFRRMAEAMRSSGTSTGVSDVTGSEVENQRCPVVEIRRGLVRSLLRKSRFLYSSVETIRKLLMDLRTKIRRKRLKHAIIRKYPPVGD